jgi:hypothetical protein
LVKLIIKKRPARGSKNRIPQAAVGTFIRYARGPGAMEAKPIE